MIYYDVTKAGTSRHRSGLMRVSTRLGEALRGEVRAVRWQGGFQDVATGAAVRFSRADWLLTAELFSEEERPGFGDFIAARPCRLAAIFHDAIPLKLPQVTWPQSVARHPIYMKLLAGFELIWAVSEASRQDLLGYWRWLDVAAVPPVEVLALGADFTGAPRQPAKVTAKRALLCVGILEPRKNQGFLLKVSQALWDEGLDFELHLAGRVNPHFGRPIAREIAALQRRYRGLQHHAAASDAALAEIYGQVRATVFPTLAEGCGLPLIESLWQGVPCVASDLPALRENAAGGGCALVPVGDAGAWQTALRRVLTNDEAQAQLAGEAASRLLPTWAAAAAVLRAGLTQ